MLRVKEEIFEAKQASYMPSLACLISFYISLLYIFIVSFHVLFLL